MSDEHTVAIVSFEGAVKREVKSVRAKLKPAAEKDLLPSNEFTLTITASGRVLDGEIKISYSLSSGYYNSNPTIGRDLDEVVAETLRRAGWSKVNEPLSIAFDKTKDEEIPF